MNTNPTGKTRDVIPKTVAQELRLLEERQERARQQQRAIHALVSAQDLLQGPAGLPYQSSSQTSSNQLSTLMGIVSNANNISIGGGMNQPNQQRQRQRQQQNHFPSQHDAEQLSQLQVAALQLHRSQSLSKQQQQQQPQHSAMLTSPHITGNVLAQPTTAMNLLDLGSVQQSGRFVGSSVPNLLLNAGSSVFNNQTKNNRGGNLLDSIQRRSLETMWHLEATRHQHQEQLGLQRHSSLLFASADAKPILGPGNSFPMPVSASSSAADNKKQQARRRPSFKSYRSLWSKTHNLNPTVRRELFARQLHEGRVRIVHQTKKR